MFFRPLTNNIFEELLRMITFLKNVILFISCLCQYRGWGFAELSNGWHNPGSRLCYNIVPITWREKYSLSCIYQDVALSKEREKHCQSYKSVKFVSTLIKTKYVVSRDYYQKLVKYLTLLCMSWSGQKTDKKTCPDIDL